MVPNAIGVTEEQRVAHLALECLDVWFDGSLQRTTALLQYYPAVGAIALLIISQ